jgi:hypothetical protein
VMRIVIPKLAKDQGLVAAFQTDNLDTLRRQKFSESLENAFISSASDFYSVLNRMSSEPDFRRLLTEFALGEFKRGLDSSDLVPFDKARNDHIGAIADRGRKYVAAQFGESAKWIAINSAIWSAVREHEGFEIKLSDVDGVASVAGSEANDVLAVLALFSRPSSGLLKMEYVSAGPDGNTSWPNEEVVKQLRGWWRERTISDHAWREWAENVVVKWSPTTIEEAQRGA